MWFLYPDAVLNTGLQRLYYQTLAYVDTNGQPIGSNGAEIVDVPVLGFSLKIIAMEDDEEFAVRVESDSEIREMFSPILRHQPRRVRSSGSKKILRG